MNNSIEKIKAELANIKEANDKIDDEVALTNRKVDRCIRICENTSEILTNATKEFNGLTSILNKKDIPFFVFSVILQCAAKYIIKELREMSDKELAEKTPFHNNEKSDREHNRYYASREEIISNHKALKLLEPQNK